MENYLHLFFNNFFACLIVPIVDNYAFETVKVFHFLYNTHLTVIILAASQILAFYLNYNIGYYIQRKLVKHNPNLTLKVNYQTVKYIFEKLLLAFVAASAWPTAGIIITFLFGLFAVKNKYCFPLLTTIAIIRYAIVV